MKIKGYTRSDGVKVPAHNRAGTRANRRKYSVGQRRALEKSKTSKSGHKTWRERQKEKKPGLWANYWKKKRGKR